MDEEVIVKFSDVKWPSGFNHPTAFEKHVRKVFLEDRSGEMFSQAEMEAILMAYLQDETGICPDSLKFSIAEA